MSPDRSVLILAPSYLTFKKSPASDRIGSPLKPCYKFTWRVDLGETNAHCVGLYTPKGTSRASLNCSIYCAKNSAFFAALPLRSGKTPIGVGLCWGLVPAGVFSASLCKQVLSRGSSASWWPTTLKARRLFPNLRSLAPVFSPVFVFVWIALLLDVRMSNCTRRL